MTPSGFCDGLAAISPARCRFGIPRTQTSRLLRAAKGSLTRRSPAWAVAVEPLGNGSRHGKTSLAGVQDKIVLAWEEGWFRAYDGYPSTHILKPVTSRWPTMIFDEEYGSRFARALGLASHATSIREFDGVPALVIER